MVAEITLFCPSSRPETAQSSVFAIVDNRGMAPVIRYLDRIIRSGSEVLALAEPEEPTHVFRFTSPCENERCGHFRQGNCSLPELIQIGRPPSPAKPEYCPIRPVCRWFHQLSFEACSRCSALVTDDYLLTGNHLLGPLDPVNSLEPSSAFSERE